MFQRIIRLAESYTFVLVVALAAGLGFSQTVSAVAPYGKFLLGGIFFLSALRLNFGEVLASLRDKRLLLVVNVLMLIVFPVVVFYLTRAVAPQYALAFLLLAAMPAGMTSPFLAEISGGNRGLALVLTVSTSLLAPLTIPLLIKVLVGTEVAVSFWAMFATLGKIIFVPFALAQVVVFFGGPRVGKAAARTRPVSMVLLGLLIAGIVAQRSGAIFASLQSARSLAFLAALLILFALHFVAGWYAVFWRNRTDRITVVICLTFMNFTLAIFLAGQYFPQSDVLVPVILSVLPWSLLLIPFRAFFARSPST